MSGQLDPSRMCTKEMPQHDAASMVNYLANCQLSEDWQFGKEPYSRANPSPTVRSPRLFFSLSLSALSPSSSGSTLTQSACSFDRVLCFGRPAGQTWSAASSPTGPNTIRRTPTWGRSIWRMPSSRPVAKPAVKHEAPGSPLPSTTGRTRTKPKPSRTASRHPDAARAPPARSLLGVEARNVAPPRACSAAGQRSPGVGRQPPGGKRRPRRRLASAKW